MPEKITAPALIALAQSNNPGFRAAIFAAFDPKDIVAGTAWSGHGPDFFFAIEYPTQPALVVDSNDPLPLQHVPGPETNLWYAIVHLNPDSDLGRLHAFHYKIPGGSYGGTLDLPAFGPLSYSQSSAPAGKLSEKLTHTSKIYDGMKSDYWIYVPAAYDPKTPAALMVFQDGAAYALRGDRVILSAIDNLIAQKKIPVMICVFINPGSIAAAPGTPTYTQVSAHAKRFDRTLDDAMRSTLYDTVSDRYVRFLRDEVIAAVAAKYNLRRDAYSHAIAGASSGGICSFNAAWQLTGPEAQFSRVLSMIGSYTNIQWKEQTYAPEGGQDYPDKILREPHRNIRVWLQDGSNDMENPNWGSWPLANIRMANALKTRDYDFHLSFGQGTHNGSHGAAQFPAAMTWLWRNYDASKQEETYQQEPSEKNLPYFRVQITNRSAE